MRGRYFLIFIFALAAIALDPHSAQATHEGVPHYELSVVLLPERGELRGGALIHLPPLKEGAEPYRLHMSGFEIISLSLDEDKIELLADDVGVIEVHSGGTLTILYAVGFGNSAVIDGPDNAGVVRGGAITGSGAFLMEGWYPRVEGAGTYSLSVLSPGPLVPVSEADHVSSEKQERGILYKFILEEPTDGITLVAGDYTVSRAEVDGIALEAYFFEGDEELAVQYLKRTAGYIKMYTQMIGPFPYKRFAVVESAWPTGYSMPTYTLIGQQVARLPFILDTSLGHEVLHQWLGNSIRVSGGGNWAEGMTSYLADHHYEDLKGQGAEYRKRLLTDFVTYVSPASEITLSEFVSRTGHATRAVGYAKGAMLFHMLKKEVGEEAFSNALKEFYSTHRGGEAGWHEIQMAFELASDKDLGWFFIQWVEQKGLVNFVLSDVRHLALGGDRLDFVIKQAGPQKRFTMPLDVYVASLEGKPSVHRREVQVQQQTNAYTLEFGGPVVSVVFDPDYDIMRALSSLELPPTVSALTARPGVFVRLDGESPGYGAFSAMFAERGYEVVNAADLKFSQLNGKPAVVAANAEGVLRVLFAKVPAAVNPEAGVSIEVMGNPLYPGNALAVLHSDTEENAALAAPKLTHYGRYSRLAFKGGRNVLKETADSSMGVRRNIAPEVVGIRTSSAIGLGDIIREAARKPIVFVGEAHTEYAHHKVQLEFIRQMKEAGHDIAIGMEMFQTPFQNALDNYVAGDTDEEEFLRQSEYFTRWTYNYHLYREILDYARTHGIQVVALNQKAEVVQRVSRGGLDALSDEQRAMLPADMDLTDEAYRSRLRSVFGQHAAGKAFDNFYLAQIIWDETMARSVAEYMGANPGRKMVVITGQGHTAWRSGIPRRVARLSGLDYSLVIQDDSGVLSPEMADFVLFSSPMKAPDFPVIGIMAGTSDKGILVEEVSAAGAAEAAGIQKSDIITMAAGQEMKKLVDLKLLLFNLRPGDKLEVKVLRKRLLFGRRELAVEVEIR